MTDGNKMNIHSSWFGRQGKAIAASRVHMFDIVALNEDETVSACRPGQYVFGVAMGDADAGEVVTVFVDPSSSPLAEPE